MRRLLLVQCVLYGRQRYTGSAAVLSRDFRLIVSDVRCVRGRKKKFDTRARTQTQSTPFRVINQSCVEITPCQVVPPTGCLYGKSMRKPFEWDTTLWSIVQSSYTATQYRVLALTDWLTDCRVQPGQQPALTSCFLSTGLLLFFFVLFCCCCFKRMFYEQEWVVFVPSDTLDWLPFPREPHVIFFFALISATNIALFSLITRFLWHDL